MYISKLKIQGFKSFLNKTELNFGQGITSIVGPNGCGKTNIVDAIRWILGEQKTSVLRSDKMQDVIFNGSKSQKSTSMCEASLTIHNNLGVLPVEYSDIEITRRLFRSGESEYFLNKSRCRLKDINELFIDTGMSSNAYSVIELKMIESILSETTDNRRLMFEEAAGINQYKSQRKLALKKLDSTNLDMERIKDILNEVETKLRNLRLQLKKFDKHKKMTQELESKQILLAKLNIDEIVIKRHPLEQNLKLNQGNQKSLSSQLTLDESLIKKKESDFSKVKNNLTNSQKQLDSVVNSLQDVNQDILVWTEQKKSNESKLQHFSDEIHLSKGRLQSLVNQSKEIDKNLSNINPEIILREKKYNQINSHYADLNKKFTSSQSDLEQVKNNLNKINHSIIKVNSEKESILEYINFKEKFFEKLKEQKKDIESLILNSNADVNLLKSEIQSLESVNSKLRLNLENYQKIQNDIELKLHTKDKQLSDQRLSLADTENRLEFFNNILEKNEGRSSGVKWVLKSTKFNNIVGVIGDLVSADSKYELAVNNAIESLATFLVVETLETAREIIKEVTKRKLQISIISIDAIPKNSIIEPHKDNIVNFIQCPEKLKTAWQLILSNIYLVDSQKSYLKLSKKDILKSWVTLNGERFDGKFVLQSKTALKDSTSIGRFDKINKLKNLIISKIKKIEVLESDILKLKSNADSSIKDLKACNDALDSSVIKVNSLNNKLSKIMFVITQQEKASQDIDKQLTTNKNEIIKSANKAIAKKDALDELNVKLNEYEKKLKLYTKELEKIELDKNNFNEKVQDARVSLIEIQKENEGLEFRQKSYSGQVDELEKRIQRFSINSEKLTNEINRTCSSIDSATQNKSKLIAKQSEYNNIKNKYEADFNKVHEDLQNLQESVRNRQKTNESRILELKEIELKLADLNQQEIIIRQKIKELYNREINISDIYDEEVDINDLKKQIKFLNTSLEQVGAINMAVKEEYEIEDERYNFLKKQYDDLLDSQKTLNNTIIKIDKDARSKFLNTYQQIANYFKDTYKMFFEGGEASLRLVSDDPLDSNIEIIAKPPGKSPQTLRMLSTGEKALTAISLLFAIYMVKPSPFCILDEIDAPLDDQNINRFTKVLKTFSDKTQFIVVTHNKLTMEKSNYLYGVTQIEKGISKIVSVKFSDK